MHHFGSANSGIYLDNTTLAELDNQLENGLPLHQVDAQAQKDCFCPGGKGERIWEDLEGWVPNLLLACAFKWC